MLTLSPEKLELLKEMSLVLVTVHWFAKFLFDCPEGNVKEFYSTIREGNQSFVAHKCSNVNSNFMSLVEYGGGNKREFFLSHRIRRNMDGGGWRRLYGRSWH